MHLLRWSVRRLRRVRPGPPTHAAVPGPPGRVTPAVALLTATPRSSQHQKPSSRRHLPIWRTCPHVRLTATLAVTGKPGVKRRSTRCCGSSGAGRKRCPGEIVFGSPNQRRPWVDEIHCTHSFRSDSSRVGILCNTRHVGYTPTPRNSNERLARARGAPAAA